MKFYNTDRLERIGFDFYCDIANRIVKAREDKGITQDELARLSKIKKSRITNMENVKIRIGLDDLKILSDALNVSVDWLIEAELDAGGKECLYLVWTESCPDFKIYKKATSQRMAFLLFDKMFKDSGVRYNSCRERFFVKLVGIPVSKEELQAKFPKRSSEDQLIEPDDREEV